MVRNYKPKVNSSGDLVRKELMIITYRMPQMPSAQRQCHEELLLSSLISQEQHCSAI